MDKKELNVKLLPSPDLQLNYRKNFQGNKVFEKPIVNLLLRKRGVKLEVKLVRIF